MSRFPQTTAAAAIPPEEAVAGGGGGASKWQSAWSMDLGGVRGMNGDCTERAEIYYMGVIDILQVRLVALLACSLCVAVIVDWTSQAGSAC